MILKKLTLTLCLLSLLLANVHSRRHGNDNSGNSDTSGSDNVNSFTPLHSVHITDETGNACQIAVNVLTLSWPASFCSGEHISCFKSYIDNWDHRSFSIHGLWPGPTAYSRSSPCGRACLRENRFSQESLNIEALKNNNNLLLKMLQFWFPYSTNDQIGKAELPFLWDHEWGSLKRGSPDTAASHGKCYAKIQQLLGSQLSGIDHLILDSDQANFVQQTSYFAEVIRLYESLGLTKLEKDTFTKTELAQLMKLNQFQFYPKCSGNQVQQLSICYTVDVTGKLQPQHCDEQTLHKFWGACGNEVHLPNFDAENTQQQVFNFAQIAADAQILSGIIPESSSPVRDEN